MAQKIFANISLRNKFTISAAGFFALVGVLNLLLLSNEGDASGLSLANLSILAALLAGVTAAFHFVAGYFTTPVAAIVEGAKRIQAGGMESSLNADGNDEFGRIASALNDVARHLMQQKSDAQQSQNAIEAFANEVSRTATALHNGDLSARIDGDVAEGELQGIAATLNEIIDAMTRPLQAARDAIKRLADGNLPQEIQLSGFMQDISNSLNLIKQNLAGVAQQSTNLQQWTHQGQLHERASQYSMPGEYKAIIDNMNQTIDNMVKPINETITSLQAIAGGDLSVEVTGSYQGDLAVMKNALNGTLSTLNDLIGQSNEIVQQVAEGSQQVSDASRSLSDGATRQASSLQEITASMQEISSQTKQNAENASQANDISDNAKTSAAEGNQQMKKMLVAISEIKKSSDQIYQIIKAIDEIAFQTNLLALNAAVEAARAGVHGKGFAVVAEEVRNLAQRSARAAQETSELIEDSVMKVENGTKIANTTAKALDEIVTDVARVSDLVSEIASASQEQAHGIEQVNSGLIQVDQVTQSNTASAEEGAAAAETLSHQAVQLKQMLSRFKLKTTIGISTPSRFGNTNVTVIDEH